MQAFQDVNQICRTSEVDRLQITMPEVGGIARAIQLSPYQMLWLLPAFQGDLVTSNSFLSTSLFERNTKLNFFNRTLLNVH